MNARGALSPGDIELDEHITHQDSIRRSCVDGAVALSGIFSPEENRQHILILLQTAAEDKFRDSRLEAVRFCMIILTKLQLLGRLILLILV